MDTKRKSSLDFVQRRLPWIVAAGGLLVYVLTFRPGINANGLLILAKALGWDWQPLFLAPVFAVVTYPIRWLPTTWQLLALNLFSIVCSALTLALLARTITILPHDRTREQRALERSEYSFLSIRAAWLPPLLAALVCGLQLSFWENAIVVTGESMDILLFAYCLRCLMEYRAEQKDSWLYRMALVYGLAITNNYAMIAFLPLFVGALVWIQGRQFFRLGFLLRMLGLGTAGLTLYLLLPALNNLAGLTDYSFLEILRTHLSSQRNTLLEFPRFLLVILAFTSVLPVVFIGIWWPAQYGDISPAGNLLANLMMQVVHALFLIACLWVLFDPTFSPRTLGARYGQPWAFLPFYYLAALTVGYCSGYFLLVLSASTVKPWQRPSWLEKGAKKVALGLVWVTLVAVPAALLYRNLPELKSIRAPHLEQYGVAAAGQLPPEGAIVLSDDPYRLFAVQSALRRAGKEDRYAMVQTTPLSELAYHRYLQRTHPNRWSQLPQASPPRTHNLHSTTLIQFLAELQETNPIYYLHPSFGYYFEFFNLQARNLVYRMALAPTNQISTPLLTETELASNDRFWQEYRPQLTPLLQQLDLKLNVERRNTSFAATLAGTFHSRALNYLGVEFQRAGNLSKAAEYFHAALQFNTNNLAAFINQLYNRQWQSGNRKTILPNKEIEERLQVYRGNLEMVLNLNGPIDEPNVCSHLGRVFANGRNFRQSVQQLERAVALDPNSYETAIALTISYARLNKPDRALQEIARLRAFPAFSATIATNPLPLLQAEALAYAMQENLPQAMKLLGAAQKSYPQEAGPFATEAQIHLARNDLTNALRLLVRQIAVQSNNVPALIDCGVLSLRTESPQAAIPLFNRALALDPDNASALRNRALAYLKLDDGDAALKDYQTLLSMLPKPPHWIHYGLGEAFFKKKNAPKAIEHYQKFLKLAPAELPEIPTVKDRIKKLKRGTF